MWQMSNKGRGVKMTKEEKKDWQILYELGEQILNLKPWKVLWDSNLCYFKDKDTHEEYYFCTMGHNKEFRGVSVYTKEQFKSYYEIAFAKYPSLLMLNYQECVTCTYCEEEEVIPRNIEIINELGLNFKKDWISFEAFKKGYFPSAIDHEQVKMLNRVLPHYLELVKDYIKNKIHAEFNEGKLYTRTFNKESKEYENKIDDLKPYKVTYSFHNLPFKMVQNIQKCRKRNYTLEVDFLNFLGIHIKEFEEDNGIVRCPVGKFIADHGGFIFYCQIDDIKKYKNKEEYVMNFFAELLKVFKEVGLPSKILVRDRETLSYINEIVEIIGCEVEISPKLFGIDHIYEAFNRNNGF